MATWSQKSLLCQVCGDIFKDPVLLECSHSCCRSCFQNSNKRRLAHKCPVCKTKSVLCDPTKNLALKNVCDETRSLTASAAFCKLHNETMKLFCEDDQELVCVICMHSHQHTNHRTSPVDEAAADHRAGLRETLQPLKDELDLYQDVKRNFDQAAEDIDAQAEDTERRIRDEFTALKKLLEKEEQLRISAVRREKQQKSEVMKRKSDGVRKEISALSDAVRSTEEVLRDEDVSFLQRYKAAAEVLHTHRLTGPKPVPGALMDTSKHLNNLPRVVFDSVRVDVSRGPAVVKYPKPLPVKPLLVPPNGTLRNPVLHSQLMQDFMKKFNN